MLVVCKCWGFTSQSFSTCRIKIEYIAWARWHPLVTTVTRGQWFEKVLQCGPRSFCPRFGPMSWCKAEACPETAPDDDWKCRVRCHLFQQGIRCLDQEFVKSSECRKEPLFHHPLDLELRGWKKGLGHLVNVTSTMLLLLTCQESEPTLQRHARRHSFLIAIGSLNAERLMQLQHLNDRTSCSNQMLKNDCECLPLLCTTWRSDSYLTLFEGLFVVAMVDQTWLKHCGTWWKESSGCRTDLRCKRWWSKTSIARLWSVASRNQDLRWSKAFMKLT